MQKPNERLTKIDIQNRLNDMPRKLWVVIEESHKVARPSTYGYRYYWKCKCKGCNTIHTINQDRLLSKIHNFGCHKCSNRLPASPQKTPTQEKIDNIKNKHWILLKLIIDTNKVYRWKCQCKICNTV